MKIICWNCRGLGNSKTRNELCEMVRRERPSLLFLCETKIESKEAEFVRVKMGFYGCFTVSREGLRGGLMLLWSDEIEVKVCSFSKGHIDATIGGSPGTQMWRFTGFYGNPDTEQRKYSWELLLRLKSLSSLPWVCGGDFNEIISNTEKLGGRPRPNFLMNNFLQTLDKCEFKDLGFCGSQFTWSKNCLGNENIQERLDRFVGSPEWMEIYKNFKVQHLISTTSDHAPIMLMTEFGVRRRRRGKLFKFEDMWVKHPGCEEVVSNGWGLEVQGSKMYKVCGKIKNCRLALCQWNRRVFGNVKQQIKEKRDMLTSSIQRNVEDSQGIIKILKSEINDLLEKEEVLWKQRARTDWLKEGDCNTRFFHHKASQRKRKNNIEGIENGQGDWVIDDDQIEDAFTSYFSNIFTSSNPQGIEEILAVVGPVVTTEMNSMLLRDFNADDVKTALFQMAPSKAPGPDGMNANFYQQYWHVVGSEITEAVLSFFKSGLMLKSLNFTYIALVPKIKNPRKVTDYRPISLCNVVYKIISKMLANRLKLILPHIISENQSAFVPGRLISDNVLVAFETLHAMKNKRGKGIANMALKLDMSKAYDRVEWIFLEKMMYKMGFEARWINLIMECVKTVSYSIIINGAKKGFIKPSRGIRQGDPLSPYLFLLCAEGFSSLIRDYVSKGLIHGVVPARNSPRISHLFFADDSVLFCQANMLEFNQVRSLIAKYEAASGQSINSSKTKIFFSSNTPRDIQDQIVESMGAIYSNQYEKYLGLPTLIGKSRKMAFQSIKDRVWNKLKGWKEKLLSQGGKEVLIKAVAQSIPTYAMCCFQLPKTLCMELNSLMASFWWGQRQNEQKIHWTSWENMCMSKTQGGMGFRDLYLFNQALLAKQGWNLIKNKSSLIYRVLKARYFPNGDFLTAKLGYNPSYTWRSILGARDILLAGLRWRIGGGEKVSIWHDKWLPTPSTFKVVSPPKVLPDNARVSDLIDLDTGWWKAELVEEIFLPHEAKIIKRIPILPGADDTLIWWGNANGIFSVKSAYHIAVQRRIKESNGEVGSSTGPNDTRRVWKSLWKANVPNKVKVFMWRACKNILPNFQNLEKRRVLNQGVCPICRSGNESSIHSFWECKIAVKFWKKDMSSKYPCQRRFGSLWFLVLEIVNNVLSLELEWFMIACWKLWYYRNMFVHNGEKLNVQAILDSAKNFYWEWKQSTSIKSRQQDKHPTRWSPPSNGLYKVNFDGALFNTDHKAGVGVIVRNEKGMVMAALSAPISLGQDAYHVEAIAALRAVRFAFEAGFQDIVLEGDALGVINAIARSEPDLSSVGHIIHGIRSFCSVFRKFSIVHARREANSAAHGLARKARSYMVDKIWIEDVPPCISEEVAVDVLSLNH